MTPEEYARIRARYKKAQKAWQLARAQRDEAIRRERDAGATWPELARRWHMTQGNVGLILKAYGKEQDEA